MSTAVIPSNQNGSTALSVQPATQTVLTGDIITNPAMFDHVQRLAKLLAHGAFTPKHLKRATAEETVATCFRVAAQAIRWGFDPFAVADETYEVHGRLGYQGKLVIAVVNSRAGLSDRLSFTYAGSGANLTVTVSGTFKDEPQPRTVSLSVAQAKTANEMWVKDPEQKLAYSGAIKWARRHCPEVVMGVHTIEDLEAAAANDHPRTVVTSLSQLTDKFAAPEVQEPQADANGEIHEPNDDPLMPWDARINEAETIEQCEAILPDIQVSSLKSDQMMTVSGWVMARIKKIKGK